MNIIRHWPTMLLGFIVAAILIAVMFVYQVNETEVAVVTRFSKPLPESPQAGLHFKWPYPFEQVYKYDKRSHAFSGETGKLEEFTTKDGKSVIVGLAVIYNIDDAIKFYNKFSDIRTAESHLNSWMRSTRSAVIGQYNFNQLLNTDPKEMKLNEIEKSIQTQLRDKAMAYGLDVTYVGITTLNLPANVTKDVFARMIQERTEVAQRILTEGQTAANEIRTAANTERSNILAAAEGKSKEIRAAGDSQAAKYLSTLKEDPELALFLRQLESLRKVMQGGKSTVVFATEQLPFNQFDKSTLSGLNNSVNQQ